MAQQRVVRRDDVRLDELRPTPGIDGASRLTRRQLAATLGSVAGLVGGAWLVGGRLSIDQLGAGGVARTYLPGIGDKAPPLGMYDSDGKVVFLSAFEGRPVWINFWGSWCPPCQAELPEIEEAYRTLTPQGVVLLAVSMKEPFEVAERFARSLGATFPVYNIPDPTLLDDAWDVRNFPTHVYLDQDGVVSDIVLQSGTTAELVDWGERLVQPPAGSTSHSSSRG